MHHHATTQSTYTAADYGHVLRRRWPWLLGAILLGLGAGYVAMDRVPPTYAATAHVLVEPAGLTTTEITGGRTSGVINLDTEAQLVQSSEVAARAAEALESPTGTEELADHLSITVPPNSQVLSIAYEGGSPAAAQAGAQAFAQAYLDNRRELAQADVDAAVATFSEERAEKADELRDVSADLGDLDADDPARPYIENQQQILTQQVNALDAQIREVSNANTRPGRVISDAVPPSSPAGFSSRLFLLGGGMLGLLLGLAAALFRERTDPRVRDAREVESITDEPVLGSVPSPRTPASRSERNAYARLRNVLLSSAATGDTVVAFTGVGAAAPTRRIVTGLAAALESAGRSVIVADATPDQDSSADGLSDLIRGTWAPEPSPDDGRIGAGSDPAGLPELLAGPQAADAFETLRRAADIVLVTSPPTADAAAQSLATLVDAVVPVVTLGSSRRAELEDAVDTFADVDATVLGVVLAARGRGRDGDDRRVAAESAARPESDDDTAPEPDGGRETGPDNEVEVGATEIGTTDAGTADAEPTDAEPTEDGATESEAETETPASAVDDLVLAARRTRPGSDRPDDDAHPANESSRVN